MAKIGENMAGPKGGSPVYKQNVDKGVKMASRLGFTRVFQQLISRETFDVKP